MYKEAQILRALRQAQGIDLDENISRTIAHREKYKSLSKIEREFHDQKAVKLSTEWVDLTACYTILNREASEENPIIFITGASNGVESVDSFVRELAYKHPKRRVYVLGYPDAPSGKVTEEFYNAVKTADGFGPHTAVFKQMINFLHPAGSDENARDFELWAYSAGGAIVSTLLTDQTFAGLVNNIVLLCPYGATAQTAEEFNKGFSQDARGLIYWLKEVPRFVFIGDPSKGEQKTWKYSTWMALKDQGQKQIILSQLPHMRLREKAKLVIVSGENDQITKSAKTFNRDTEPVHRELQPTLEVDIVPHALHNGPFLQPELFIEAAEKKLRPSQLSTGTIQS